LTQIKGIGLKLASMFVRNTRGEKIAVLDVHIRNWLKQKYGPGLPNSYYEQEKLFLQASKELGKDPIELDLEIWERERRGKKVTVQSSSGEVTHRCPVCFVSVKISRNKSIGNSIQCSSCKSTVRWADSGELIGTLHCPFCNSPEMFRKKTDGNHATVKVQFECFRTFTFNIQDVARGDELLQRLLSAVYSKMPVTSCPSVKFLMKPSGGSLIREA